MLPLLQNILHQPAALRGVVDYQFGPGLDSIRKAADRVLQSKQVVISGMGASLFSTIPFTYWLAEHGIAASAVETSELLYFLEGTIQPDTAVILVSRSGESIETLKLLPALAARSCTVIGISNVPASTLAQQADISILLNSPADELVAIQTYTATVMVLAVLAAFCVGNEPKVRTEAHAAIEGASEMLRTFETSGPINDFVGNAPLYVLGRGTSIGSMQESVLLMHEVAKTPAVGMSGAAFRHGPVEVLYRKIRAVVFGTAPQTSELDRALASDIAGLGAQVGWIGPGEATGSVRALCPWPSNIAPLFAPVLEILPIQWLSMKTAEADGLRPGEFRFAPAVTASETGFLKQGER